MQVFIILSILFVFLFNARASYYEPKHFILACFASVLLSISVYWSSNIWFALLYGYILLSSMYHGLFCNNRGGYLFIQFESMRSAICVLSVGVLFCAIDMSSILAFKKIVPYLLIGNFFFKFIPERFRSVLAPNGKMIPMVGIGANTSVDSTLISILWAVMATSSAPEELFFASTFCTVGGLYLNKATAGALAFFFSVFIFIAFKCDLPYFALYLTAWVALAAIHYRERIFADSGRLFAWKFIIKRVLKNKIFGSGVGVFKYNMPLAQKIYKDESEKMRGEWIWAHNDFLQMFIECGALGIILLIAFFASIVPTMNANDWIFFSSIFVNCLFNFPTHLAPEIVVIVVYLKEYFSKQPL